MEGDRGNGGSEVCRHSRPLTSFGIDDILNHKVPSCGDRQASSARPPLLLGFRPPKPPRPALKGNSPIHALEHYVLANTTLGNLENDAPHSDSAKKESSTVSKKGACKNNGSACSNPGQSGVRKRKSRTNFNHHQLLELEKRFLYQKYLTPTDRDEVANSLGLASSQVITWFQNRRAKLKRDLEELRADVTAARSISERDGSDPADGVNLENLATGGGDGKPTEGER